MMAVLVWRQLCFMVLLAISTNTEFCSILKFNNFIIYVVDASLVDVTCKRSQCPCNMQHFHFIRLVCSPSTYFRSSPKIISHPAKTNFLSVPSFLPPPDYILTYLLVWGIGRSSSNQEGNSLVGSSRFVRLSSVLYIFP